MADPSPQTPNLERAETVAYDGELAWCEHRSKLWAQEQARLVRRRTSVPSLPAGQIDRESSLGKRTRSPSILPDEVLAECSEKELTEYLHWITDLEYVVSDKEERVASLERQKQKQDEEYISDALKHKVHVRRHEGEVYHLRRSLENSEAEEKHFAAN